jgi:hypothetical protein
MVQKYISTALSFHVCEYRGEGIIMKKYDLEDIYEPHLDCENCVDFRKNLKCCREIVDLIKRQDALEARLEAIENKNRDQK